MPQKTEEINTITTTVAEYSATAAALSALRAKLQGAKYDVTTTAGMDTAKKDRRELVTLRTDLEKKRVEIKAPALERCRQIDAEAKRITGELLLLEQPIDAQIKAEEERKATIKAEKERLERERVAAIRERIDKIKGLPILAVDAANALELEEFIAKVEAREIGADFAEFATEAQTAKAEAVAKLKEMLASRKEQEAEAERVRLEQENTARLNSIRDKIRVIQDWPRGCVGLDSNKLKVCRTGFSDDSKLLTDASVFDFGELLQDAISAAADSLAEIDRMIDVATETEEASAKLKRDQEELGRQQQATAAENARISKIHTLIGEIRYFPAGLVGLDSATISSRADNFKLGLSLLDDAGREVYAEFTEEAERVRLKAVEQVDTMFAAAEKSEKDAADLKRQQDEIATAQKKIDDENREKQERETAGQAEREAKQVLDDQRGGSDLAVDPDVTIEVEMVTITKAEYDQLCADSDLLNALRAAGVDNWDGWDFACESLREVEA